MDLDIKSEPETAQTLCPKTEVNFVLGKIHKGKIVTLEIVQYMVDLHLGVPGVLVQRRAEVD